MKTLRLIALLLVAIFATRARATVVFDQPHNGTGTVTKSAWYPPDGLDGDAYAWDNFTLSSSVAISEIHWRGGYTNYLSGAGRAPVFAFTISIYRSIGGNSQPDLGTGGRLVQYQVGGNAGETLAGTFGGTQMYDYVYALPTAFQAAAGTTYWIQIEASQGVTPTYGWPPDWGPASGSGGNNSHFYRITGGPTYASAGDLAFSLYTASVPTATITASANPAGAAVITGAGAYAINSAASLLATPNTGWGFVNWTEGSTQASTNPHYNFIVSANRTLVANFIPAYTMTTSSFPTYAGTTSGDGVFNSGSTVTLIATPAPGYVFSTWSELGAPVSTSATYTFPADANHAFVANFVENPLSETFDFENAPNQTPLPISLFHDGIWAHFSATGQGYSIQAANVLGFLPQGFSGLCIYPSSVFASDLLISFSETMTDFSVLYSTQELACDNSATMRVTAYSGTAFAGTNTTTAPIPGTWPSGTLSIHVAAGFDNVVVHYDARPPTCQDYGVIFLADNVTVTRLCTSPNVAVDPLPTAACRAGAAHFAVTGAGTWPLAYQWQRETTPGTFVDLLDGPTASWDGAAPGVGATVSGASTAALTIAAATAEGGGLAAVHAINYRCVVTNPCGGVNSAAAKLHINTADFNGDGDVGTDADIEAFFACLAGNCCPTCGSADFNGDGDVGTDADIEAFFRLLSGGAC